jgi:hypothetical protein
MISHAELAPGDTDTRRCRGATTVRCPRTSRESASRRRSGRWQPRRWVGRADTGYASAGLHQPSQLRSMPLPDGDIASGDPGGRADRSVSARGRPARGREARPERERVGQHCPGITGRSREMPGVATAVELYGEGGSDKEERLELRAVIAAAGLGRCLGSATANFPGTEAIVRTACRGLDESAAGRCDEAG